MTSPIHVPQDGALLLLDLIHVIRRKDKSLGSGQVVVSWVPGTFNTSGRNKRLEVRASGAGLVPHDVERVLADIDASPRLRDWIAETCRAPCLRCPRPDSTIGGAGARPDRPINGHDGVAGWTRGQGR